MTWASRSIWRWTLRLLVASGAGPAATAWMACGAAIDLGGSDDGSVADVSALDAATADDGGEPQGAACDPCVAADDCGGGTVCARFATGADTYCATPCPGGCDAGETCRSSALASGTSTTVCAPSSGACPTAISPQSDGGVLDHCGVLTGPGVESACKSCEFSCQKNGCFGGWWCNTTSRRCVRPPKTCP